MLQKTADNFKQLKECLAPSIQEFNCDAKNGSTFTLWCRQYEDVFLMDGTSLHEHSKVYLVVQKLGLPEHLKYCKYILLLRRHSFPLKSSSARTEFDQFTSYDTEIRTGILERLGSMEQQSVSH